MSKNYPFNSFWDYKFKLSRMNLLLKFKNISKDQPSAFLVWPHICGNVLRKHHEGMCDLLCAHWLVIITFRAQTGKPLMRWCHLFMQACCFAYIYWLVLKREENMSSWEVYDESLITTEEQLLFSLISSSAVKLIPKMGNENDCCTHATIYGITGMFPQAKPWMTVLTSQY